MISQLHVPLNGGAVGHRVAAVIGRDSLRVLRLLRRVVVIAQRSAQGLGLIQLPAAFSQHVVDGFVIRRGTAAALTDIPAIPARPGHKAIEGISAAKGAGTHPEAVIAGGGSAKYAIAAGLSGLEQVFRIGSVIGDHPAHRAAAIQQGRWPAHDLNALNQRRVEEGTVQVTGISALTHAVNQHQHAATIVAAQIDVLAIGTTGPVERQTGHVA